MNLNCFNIKEGIKETLELKEGSKFKLTGYCIDACPAYVGCTDSLDIDVKEYLIVIKNNKLIDKLNNEIVEIKYFDNVVIELDNKLYDLNLSSCN